MPSRSEDFGAVALIIAIVLGALYVGGTFDRALAPLGLNWGECATNGFGATFCGDDLDRYRRNVVEPARQAAREGEELGYELEREAEKAERCWRFPSTCPRY